MARSQTDKTKGVYTFTYSTTLPWLVWNEYHDANVDPDPTKYPPPAKLKKPGPYTSRPGRAGLHAVR